MQLLALRCVLAGQPFRTELMEQQTWRLVKLLNAVPVTGSTSGTRTDPQFQAVLYTHILVSDVNKSLRNA